MSPLLPHWGVVGNVAVTGWWHTQPQTRNTAFEIPCPLTLPGPPSCLLTFVMLKNIVELKFDTRMPGKAVKYLPWNACLNNARNFSNSGDRAPPSTSTYSCVSLKGADSNPTEPGEFESIKPKSMCMISLKILAWGNALEEYKLTYALGYRSTHCRCVDLLVGVCNRSRYMLLRIW